MSKQIITPRAAAQQAAQQAAKAALALYRHGCQAQAKAIWQNAMNAMNAMEAFQ